MTRDDMSERELAEYYDSHRGDVSIWQPEPVEARTPRRGGPSIVVSVRFTREELRRLKQSAAGEAVTLSEFIREAALDRTSTIASGVRTRIVAAPTSAPQLVLFTLTQTSFVRGTTEPERRSA